jgi:DNA invertase Pin-like site-specific DNA recombinase
MSSGGARGKTVRCAIYTRKSTEEGLEQAFNSLDAQREACAAYVLSQKHEGWTALPHLYDDGGVSGATMDRPALRRLLADVEAGAVDVVVVYKVDRLTRSLADFARIVAIFDAAGVSFVSVTQAFNTTNSMGRLTLNVLLSFAQFEREVTAERIRDKIAASKRKGMWMGGVVPIGYRVDARSLTPASEEVPLVRRVFERYLALGSVTKLKDELDRSGIRTPERRGRDGGSAGGHRFSRGKLYAMLRNPIFVGRIRHGDLVHPGQHPGIVEEPLWQAVQDRLAANRRERASGPHAEVTSPLAGRLFDPDGAKMRPSHANKKGRRYRYYVSAGLVEGCVAQGARGWRIPAGEIEAAVARALAARLRSPAFIGDALRAVAAIAAMADRLESQDPAIVPKALRQLVTRVDVTPTELRAEASFADVEDSDGVGTAIDALSTLGPISAVAPLRLQRRGAELRIVLGGAAAPARRPDPLLLRTVIEARRRMAAYLDREQGMSVSDIAKCEGVDVGDVSRSLQLAFLAPDLVERCLDGTQPVALTAERLKRIGELPLLWEEQRALLA